MQRFELTLPRAAENLAVDEALLEWAEEKAPDCEYLRLWESPEPMVVVGRSSRVEKEVNQDFCGREGISILRRSSGGAAIVAGPGCLMYAVVLSYAKRPALKDITRAHAFILKQLTDSLGPVLAKAGAISCGGTSDLVIRDQSTGLTVRKFSGNSLRMKRTHLLYHGTLLYDFDLALIEKCLRMPPRQPDYRNARTHGDFMMNVPATRQQLADAVVAAFPTVSEPTDVPRARVAQLVAERFGNDEWNFEFA